MTERQIEKSRIVTPIGVVFNAGVSLLVAIVGFFLIHTLDGIDKKFDMLFRKMDEQQAIMSEYKEKVDDRFAYVYQNCCRVN